MEAGAALSSLDILGILGLGGIPVGAPQFGLVPCNGTHFGSELRSICISEAETLAHERAGSPLIILCWRGRANGRFWACHGDRILRTGGAAGVLGHFGNYGKLG